MEFFLNSFFGKTESACNAGDLNLIPGLGRSPGERKDYPLQYSGLENYMDYSPWGLKELDMTERLALHFTSVGGRGSVYPRGFCGCCPVGSVNLDGKNFDLDFSLMQATQPLYPTHLSPVEIRVIFISLYRKADISVTLIISFKLWIIGHKYHKLKKYFGTSISTSSFVILCALFYAFEYILLRRDPCTSAGLQHEYNLPAFCPILAVPLSWVWAPSKKQEVPWHVSKLCTSQILGDLAWISP